MVALAQPGRPACLRSLFVWVDPARCAYQPPLNAQRGRRVAPRIFACSYRGSLGANTCVTRGKSALVSGRRKKPSPSRCARIGALLEVRRLAESSAAISQTVMVASTIHASAAAVWKPAMSLPPGRVINRHGRAPHA